MDLTASITSLIEKFDTNEKKLFSIHLTWQRSFLNTHQPPSSEVHSERPAGRFVRSPSSLASNATNHLKTSPFDALGSYRRLIIEIRAIKPVLVNLKDELRVWNSSIQQCLLPREYLGLELGSLEAIMDLLKVHLERVEGRLASERPEVNLEGTKQSRVWGEGEIDEFLRHVELHKSSLGIYCDAFKRKEDATIRMDMEEINFMTTTLIANQRKHEELAPAEHQHKKTLPPAHEGYIDSKSPKTIPVTPNSTQKRRQRTFLDLDYARYSFDSAVLTSSVFWRLKLIRLRAEMEEKKDSEVRPCKEDVRDSKVKEDPMAVGADNVPRESKAREEQLEEVIFVVKPVVRRVEEWRRVIPAV